ncbi:hypothetical protein KP509_12G015400 [Ceratopteris richardii]|uniref:FLZ-type domain-containing protein n=1 Tax=Ceratopteris richardii TaxID=49495 RepID=A0A8T2TJE7_CERRI|nr:hypothetical protein KP509_12G015400 [Ceratopteris richardii]
MIMGAHTAMPNSRTAFQRARLEKPHVPLAPHQVQIGFELGPRNGNSDNSLPNSGSRRSSNPSFLFKQASGKSSAVTPRSVLQELLSPLPQSVPAPATSTLATAAKSHLNQTVHLFEASLKLPINGSPISESSKHEGFNAGQRIGKFIETEPMVIGPREYEPITAPPFLDRNKGFAELVRKPLVFASRNYERINRSSISSSMALKAIKRIAQNGEIVDRKETQDGAEGILWINQSKTEDRGRIKIAEVVHNREHLALRRCKITTCVEDMSIDYKCRSCRRHEGARGNVNLKGCEQRRNIEKTKKSSLFVLSEAAPAIIQGNYREIDDNFIGGGHIMDMVFLRSCFLCKRPLGQGQDAYMYSGDKAFCSEECRYQQIVFDERKEKHPPRVIRSGAPTYPSFMSANVSSTIAVSSAAINIANRHPAMIKMPNFLNPAAAA